MIWTIVPIVVVLWLISGQMLKGLRRYAIPVLATIYVALLKDKKRRRLAWIMLVLTAILSAGYGENSALRKLLGGSDFWTRIVIGVLVASVPMTYGIISHGFGWQSPFILAMNVSAWQVHAGTLCKIGRYDVLIEDICRATALGISIAIM